MKLLTLIGIVVLVTLAAFAVVTAAPDAPAADPPPPPPCIGDCVPRAELVAAQQLAAKRLRGWNHANHRILALHRTVRYFAFRRGTGVPWLDAALCVHGYESKDWANRGHHYGGMQFNLGTWQSVGGRGNPADAHPVEQLYRAFLVWSRDGGSWREWSTAPLCGLR